MNTIRAMAMALALYIAASLNPTVNLLAQGMGPARSGTPPAGVDRWELVPKAAETAVGQLSRVYIQFRTGQKAVARGLVESVGGQLHYEFDRLNAVAATVPAAALQSIRSNPNITLVENDPPRHPLGCELTPEQVPYGIDLVQAPSAASLGITGDGVKVGVIDSGVLASHPDFAGLALSGELDGWDTDGFGHGTHVCGTIAAQQNGFGVVGVSPAVSIHMVKVFGSDGSWTYSSTLLAAAQACEAAGCNIISMSLGGGYSAVEDLGFHQLYQDGLLLVAAAGNTGSTNAIYPSGYASVISVAAVDNQSKLASFSTRNADVELAAAGVDVFSTMPDCEESSLLVGTGPYQANHLQHSGYGVVTAPLVDGGLGNRTSRTWRGKVVLVERGEITFADKVANVEKSGGLACVIYNTNLTANFSGTLNSSTSSIPAVSISGGDGQLLKTKLGQDATVSSSVSFGAGSYGFMSGTSMSTPHVSGVAALVWSAAKDQPNGIIRAALQAGALDLGDPGRDHSFGFGLVRADASLGALDTDLAPVVDIQPPLEISNVSSQITNAKRGLFDITWDTNIPANSQVEFVGQAGAFTDSGYATHHRMSFRGPKGASADYYVTSTDAYGNTLTSGPYSHQN